MTSDNQRTTAVTSHFEHGAPVPRIAVTMGDPAGVGPELCLRLLADAAIAGECVPIVFGDAGVLRRVADGIGLPFTAPVITKSEWPAVCHGVTAPSVLDFQLVE